MKTKKSLGQHFLKSQKAIQTIVETSCAQKGDLILEIGPGMGVLTEALLQTGADVVAVEKDDLLIPVLSEKFEKEITSGKLKIIHEDILIFKFKSLGFSNLDEIQGGQKILSETYQVYDDEKILKSNEEVRQIWKPYKLVANIPYYITGQIIRKFLETENQPISMTLLVQKEVAERIVAKDKKESLLSLSIKAYGEPKYIEKVPRGAFAPAPDVDSAIIHISNISKNKFQRSDLKYNSQGQTSKTQWAKPSERLVAREKDFFELIHAGFAHKRKQILPNLSAVYGRGKAEKALEKAKISPKARAEDIGIEKWFELCDTINTK